MNLTALATAAIAIGIAALGWNPASAQTTPMSSPPIHVTNLQYTPGDSGDDVTTLGQPGLMLTFENVSTRPIHAVVFAVTDASGYELGTVSRHGTFSPGVLITRYFGELKLKDKHGDPARATPIEVGFQDGTTWTPSK